MRLRPRTQPGGPRRPPKARLPDATSGLGAPAPSLLGTRTAVLLSRPPPSRDLPTAGLPEDSLSSPVTRGCREVAPPWSGGVMVIIWAVNSSSKYLVSVSDVTWGLKGGLSCGGNGRFQAALRAPHPAPTAAPGPSPPRSAPCAPRSVSGLPQPSSTHSSGEETRGAGPPAPREDEPFLSFGFLQHWGGGRWVLLAPLPGQTHSAQLPVASAWMMHDRAVTPLCSLDPPGLARGSPMQRAHGPSEQRPVPAR